MLGNPLGDLLASKEKQQTTEAETLKLIEGVLDYIQANLNNIRNTWGSSSPQYKAASEIMQKYFNENMKKMKIDVQDTNLEDLLANMSLDENSASGIS